MLSKGMVSPKDYKGNTLENIHLSRSEIFHMPIIKVTYL